MAVYHADALVIRSREYGESDRLLTLFSREKGKIQAIAKGVRKPNSKQRAGVQMFTYADFLLYRGKSLDTVSQANPKESFRHLWDDLDRSMAASAMAELLDVATFPEQPQPELFALTLTSLFLLEHIDPILLQGAYALRLLTVLGYKPRLGECANCGQMLNAQRLYFSSEGGGTLCSQCREDVYGRWIGAGSIALMRMMLMSDLRKLDRLRWNERMKLEIIGMIQFYCEQKFDRNLRSWSMGNRLTRDDVGQQDCNGKEGQ